MIWILLQAVPWGTLISLLFKWLSKKYGSGFMGWVLALIAENAEAINFGRLTKAGAESRNIDMIQEATKGSPSINKSEAKFINLIAYLKWLSDNKPGEFRLRVERFMRRGRTAQKYNDTDFMRFYTSRPDRKTK